MKHATSKDPKLTLQWNHEVTYWNLRISFVAIHTFFRRRFIENLKVEFISSLKCHNVHKRFQQQVGNVSDDLAEINSLTVNLSWLLAENGLCSDRNGKSGFQLL
ncbi:hypothetical protein CEXT_29621 [Caerostris extrusa]|uniref:Uncharacterized protein n=1 Tax=Caerostris extrusa TaxID=172846 RepID=A0AAV4U5U9_CAEEX|nr:hypothetical protein CEXT_29621 [Caerostris extrusa]